MSASTIATLIFGVWFNSCSVEIGVTEADFLVLECSPLLVVCFMEVLVGSWPVEKLLKELKYRGSVSLFVAEI